jgi:hypothetical protein
MSVKQLTSVLGYVGMSQSVDRNEWYTPQKYLSSVRLTLGEIDFDPYSDAIANKMVQANRFRSKEDDQGAWPEVKTVFMNPPYSRGSVERAVYELLEEWRKQDFTAIVLTNNATETKWFQMLLLYANAVCLTDHRIAFYSVDGKAVSGNTRGQAFFYFGNNFQRFHTAFCGFGYTFPLPGMHA